MKTLLITGASSGIGEAMAREAVSKGNAVVGVARREKELERLRGELGNLFSYHVADTSDPVQVARVVGSLERLPDTVILNAGVGEFDSRKEFKTDIHRRTFEINYFGAIYWVEELLPRFKERGSGTFAVVSSLAGYRGLPLSIAYAASKAAVRVAFEGMRVTYPYWGVRFVTICPGFVETPMNREKLPFKWTAEKAAHHILARIDKGDMHIEFPLPMKLIVRTSGLLPAKAYARAIRVPKKKE
jgi:short-subunit dehydrogenase